MFDFITVIMSLCCLTSIFAMAKMRRHRHQPLLSHAHAPQGQVQPVDHFVRPQHHVLEVFIVVSEENNRTNSGGASQRFLPIWSKYGTSPWLTRRRAACRPPACSCSCSGRGRSPRWSRYTGPAGRWSGCPLCPWGCGSRWRECQTRGQLMVGWRHLWRLR